MQPDAVDTEIGQLLEQTVRIRIEFGIEQRITEDAAVGVEESDLLFACVGSGACGPRLRGGQAPQEVESRLPGLAEFLRELRTDHRPDLLAAPDGGLIGFCIWQGRTGRLERTELDPQEIVLPQREGEFLGVPVEQFEQLFVGQQVPVSPDDGDVPSLLIQLGRRHVRRQAHGQANGPNPVGGRVEDPGHSLQGNHLPVAPDECVKAVGEMPDLDGRRPIPRRQHVRCGIVAGGHRTSDHPDDGEQPCVHHTFFLPMGAGLIRLELRPEQAHRPRAVVCVFTRGCKDIQPEKGAVTWYHDPLEGTNVSDDRQATMSRLPGGQRLIAKMLST